MCKDDAGAFVRRHLTEKADALEITGENVDPAAPQQDGLTACTVLEKLHRCTAQAVSGCADTGTDGCGGLALAAAEIIMDHHITA